MGETAMRSLVFGIRFIVSMLVVLSLDTTFAAAPDYDLTREAGDVRGRITVCGAPESNVSIYAPGTSFDAVTDSSGNFKLSYVQQGTYDLIVRKGGTPLGAVTQVIVVKKQTIDIGTHDFCNDSDGDGYTPPQDCNDANPAINPGASEECGDGIDNNCNGVADENCTVCTDNDGDTYFAQAGCGTAVDCNDFDSAISPQATETCDGVDNDCDGEIDESGSNQTYFYIDSDGDGYGNLSTAVLSCSAPTGYIPEGGDCDDTNVAINPNATEECDGVDNDCNGVPDDNLEVQFCENQNGVCNGATKQCNGAAGWAECNYFDYSDSYEADEATCDGLDNDCDGTADEGSCVASIGAACLVDLECESGSCIDGVCSLP
jgi:hypothetical protein